MEHIKNYEKFLENNVSSSIPSQFDNWLQDVSQMTGLIDYTDILNYEFKNEDLPKLKKIKRFFNGCEDEEEFIDSKYAEELVNILRGS